MSRDDVIRRGSIFAIDLRIGKLLFSLTSERFIQLLQPSSDEMHQCCDVFKHCRSRLKNHRLLALETLSRGSS